MLSGANQAHHPGAAPYEWFEYYNHIKPPRLSSWPEFLQRLQNCKLSPDEKAPSLARRHLMDEVGSMIDAYAYHTLVDSEEVSHERTSVSIVGLISQLSLFIPSPLVCIPVLWFLFRLNCCSSITSQLDFGWARRNQAWPEVPQVQTLLLEAFVEGFTF
ncbi:hypothetical protein Hypma_004146 [Hypsizygus marmoreus]|uniref:Uncharacterized protein n=1 Tax=Hypsizygus marmoreus TaxID=39966 RepID=A0A369J2D3_HYPMA|nr:hypothetical protein Hypma_004146 [Hypsizygus marmoreus]